MKNIKEHRKIVRERNRERYKTDNKYRKTQGLKAKIYGRALLELKDNHKEEFNKLVKKWQRKFK